MSDPPRLLVSDLIAYLDIYLDSEHIREIYAAYLFAAEAHEGQTRKSGEPYIFHPLAVAKILASMRMDHKTIIAALLHDVIEDTVTAKEQLEQDFGSEVAHLVDGVSKLTKVHFSSRKEEQAENFRKMFLAMAQDIRVILIKLADRLHNMRTLGAMKRDSACRKSFETLEIYAPIAQRLGIAWIRSELEHLCFLTLYPWRYHIIDALTKRTQLQRTDRINNMLTTFRQRLQDNHLDAIVTLEPMHVFNIYRNAKRKLSTFAASLHMVEFKVVIQNNNIDDCYRSLGALHSVYKPVPGGFKDYICIPKNNGYQALHTMLFASEELNILLRIQNAEMDQIAHMGIAAHWLYKMHNQAEHTPHHRAKEWIKGLLEIQKNANDSLEFIENVKFDLFPDEVYVFTPTGEIMTLPRGATPVDFAFAIHTDIGNRCIGAKINRRRVDLFTPLLNGQSVQILTGDWGRPDPSWLNFVVTGKARTGIRLYLKNLQTREAYNLGKYLLLEVLKNYTLSLEDISNQRLQHLLQEWQLDNFDMLLRDIGLGKRMAPLVARHLVPDGLEPNMEQPQTLLAIKNTEGLAVNFAQCCRPIPGDEIIGLFSPGKGVVVHQVTCNNAMDRQRSSENWIDVEWHEHIQHEFLVEIRVSVTEQRGVLAMVSAAIAEQQSNIENFSIDIQKDGARLLKFILSVKSRTHLADIMREIKLIDAVNAVNRNTPKAKKMYRPMTDRRLSQLF